MLIKLLKYEFISNYKKFLTISLGIIAFGIFAKLNNNNNTFFLPNYAGIAVITSIILGLALSFFSIGEDYKKSFFSSKGLLINTLPVEKSQIITAKNIAALIWINMVFAASVLATLIYAPDSRATDFIQWVMNLRVSSEKVIPQVSMVSVFLFWLFTNIIVFWICSNIFCFNTLNNVCRHNIKFGGFANIAITLVYLLLQINIIAFLCKQVPLNLYLTSDMMGTSPIIKLFTERDEFLLQFDFTIIITLLCFSTIAYMINVKLSKDDTVL